MNNKGCNTCKYEHRDLKDYPCRQCSYSYNEKYEPKTNADKIRDMSDEELLDFICSIETYEEGSVKTIGGGVSMHTVTEVKNWLQSEAE